MLYANIEKDLIRLLRAQQVEDNTVLETDCQDYDHYRNLPDAVRYQGKVCVKTGWSSDSNVACYQSRMIFHTAITNALW